MAVNNSNTVAPFGAIAIHNLISRAETLGTGFKSWNARRKTVASLSALSDHELKDIGIHRSEIQDVSARFATQA